MRSSPAHQDALVYQKLSHGPQRSTHSVIDEGREQSGGMWTSSLSPVRRHVSSFLQPLIARQAPCCQKCQNSQLEKQNKKDKKEKVTGLTGICDLPDTPPQSQRERKKSLDPPQCFLDGESRDCTSRPSSLWFEWMEWEFSVGTARGVSDEQMALATEGEKWAVTRTHRPGWA